MEIEREQERKDGDKKKFRFLSTLRSLDVRQTDGRNLFGVGAEVAPL